MLNFHFDYIQKYAIESYEKTLVINFILTELKKENRKKKPRL